MEPHDQYNPTMTHDNTGGAVIVWVDYRNGSTSDLYAQRINASGAVHWATDGVVVCDALESQNNPDIVVFGNGGSVITWVDQRNGENDIYAQRMIDNGNPRWISNGRPICDASGSQVGPQVAIAANTFFFTWADEREGEYDIFAQRTSNLAALYWQINGISICSASANQDVPRILMDERDGAIIVWNDERNGNDDIYAQRMEPNAYWGWIRPYIVDIVDVPDDQGGKLTVIWHVYEYEQRTDFNVTHYSLWRKFPYQGAVALPAHRVNQDKPDRIVTRPDGSIRRYITTGAQTEVWEWITDVPTHQFETYAYTVTSLYDSMGTDPHWQYFMVTMWTDDPDLYWDTPVNRGYSVDNLAPGVPSGFQVTYNAGSNLLSWDESNDEDFQYFSIYRGESEDFIPSAGNLLATMTETSWVDGDGTWQHHYKISATDDAGNESDATGPDIITGGDDVPPLPASFALYQNVPNPFNPATTIRFDLPRRERVRLAVYDTSGRLVRTLVDGVREPGVKSVAWDGRNGIGRPVASGVYFYRITAGEFVQTRKMLLLQ
jgi:hypothetical protein